jgi:hypothetical protein
MKLKVACRNFYRGLKIDIMSTQLCLSLCVSGPVMRKERFFEVPIITHVHCVLYYTCPANARVLFPLFV